jgi:hypothetical protein
VSIVAALVLCWSAATLAVTATTAVAGAPSATAATAVRYVGAGPLADVQYQAGQAAAAQPPACGLSAAKLSALMLVPIFFESGSGSSLSTVPSPMTLSRYDTQSLLYAFGDPSTAYPKAFFHPGIGMWQFDSAGGWPLTAATAINTSTAAQVAAQTIANLYCNGTPKNTVVGALAPWGPDCANSACDNLFNQIFDGTSLVNVQTDPSVTSLGGMEQRTCLVASLGSGSFPCSYVDPSKAQGSKGWSQAAFGLSPISAPFYVVQATDPTTNKPFEYRYWLAADTGYAQTIRAAKPVTANARSALVWSFTDDLCDQTTGRGKCGNPFGSLDRAWSGGGAARVAGWAIDPDTSASISVRTFVDGSPQLVAPAANARPDVGAAFPASGSNHGYDATVTGLSPGSHQVCVSALDVGPGADTQLGCQSVSEPTGAPFGSLDQVVPGDNQLTVAGWAADPDTIDPIPVHVYVDGVGAATTASLPRPDVGAAMPAYGDDHGYSATIGGLTPGSHTACTYAINAGPSAGNTTLGCRTVTVLSGNPLGSFDVVQTSFGTITVAGWAFDPDSTGAATVAETIDGQAAAPFTTGAARPDVAAAFPASGPQSGFADATSPVGGGTHTVCLTVRNVGAGTGDTPLGCRTVSSPGDPIGSLDTAAASGGVITVAGWGIDPDVTGPITVRVTVGGVVVGSGSAGGSRPDVGAAFPAYGALHGYSVAVPGSAGQQVCVTAVDVAVGKDASLGCRSV